MTAQESHDGVKIMYILSMFIPLILFAANASSTRIKEGRTSARRNTRRAKSVQRPGKRKDLKRDLREPKLTKTKNTRRVKKKPYQQSQWERAKTDEYFIKRDRIQVTSLIPL